MWWGIISFPLGGEVRLQWEAQPREGAVQLESRCTMTLFSVTFTPMVFRPLAVNCVLPVKVSFHLPFFLQHSCRFF